MPAFRSTMLQLVFLGALFVSPAYLQQAPCEIVKKTVTRGTYKLNVEPSYFQPDIIYTIIITGIDNGTSVYLQAVPSKNGSSGLWESENRPISCSGIENLVEKNVSGSNTRTHWTSPNNANMESVLIKSFVSFANGTTLLQTQTLAKDTTTTSIRSAASSTPRPDASTTGSHKPALHNNSTDAHILLNSTTVHHNFASSHQWTQGPKGSASAAQGSSFLLAFLQLLSISLGFKLLS